MIFDRMVEVFDRMPVTAWYQELQRNTLQLLPPLEGLAILDLGCGTGQWAGLLASRAGRVAGLDASQAMLQRARANADAAGVTVELQQGDAENLPYADNEFALVTAIDLLYLLGRPDMCLAEINRVLKPGGWLVVVHPAAPMRQPELVRDYLQQHKWDDFARETFSGWSVMARQRAAFWDIPLVERLHLAAFELVQCNSMLEGMAEAVIGCKR